MKGKYLITTENWFYAPDGKQYRAVWGEVKLLQTKEVLGVDPNRVTANWTLQVGTDEDHILIGGCQINYSVKCPNRPNTKAVEQIIQGEKKVDEPAIYIPEPPAQKDVEMVDGKEVEWLTDRDKLVEILSVNPKFFESPMHRASIVNVVSNNDFTKFRYYRPSYGRNMVLDIMYKNGDLIELGKY